MEHSLKALRNNFFTEEINKDFEENIILNKEITFSILKEKMNYFNFLIKHSFGNHFNKNEIEILINLLKINEVNDLSYKKRELYILVEICKYLKKTNFKLFFGKSGIIDTYEKLIEISENNNFKNFMHYMIDGNKEIIELFFGELGIIKEYTDFKKLLENENFSSFTYLLSGNIQNSKSLIGINLIIKNLDDIINVLNLKNTNEIFYLMKGNLEIFNIFFGEKGIIQNIDFFLKIISNKNISNFKMFFIFKKSTLNLFIGKNKIIKNENDLLFFIENDNFIYFLKYIKEENYKLIFGRNGFLKNTNDLKSIVSDEKWSHIKKSIYKNDIPGIEKLFNIRKENSLSGNFILRPHTKTIPACPDADYLFNKILEEGDTNIVCLFYGHKKLGFYKSGVKSFLSLTNVYSKNDELILAKGWIYNLNNNGNFHEKVVKIPLDDLFVFSVYPKRPVNIDSFDEKVSLFLLYP